VHSAWSSAKQLKKAGEIMPSQEKRPEELRGCVIQEDQQVRKTQGILLPQIRPALSGCVEVYDIAY
jgi:hypothetical protein